MKSWKKIAKDCCAWDRVCKLVDGNAAQRSEAGTYLRLLPFIASIGTSINDLGPLVPGEIKLATHANAGEVFAQVLAAAETVGLNDKAWAVLDKCAGTAAIPADTTWDKAAMQWTQYLVNAYFGKSDNKLLPIKETMFISLINEMYTLMKLKGYPVDQMLAAMS